jgi:hypothetical protein
MKCHRGGICPSANPPEFQSPTLACSRCSPDTRLTGPKFLTLPSLLLPYSPRPLSSASLYLCHYDAWHRNGFTCSTRVGVVRFVLPGPSAGVFLVLLYLPSLGVCCICVITMHGIAMVSSLATHSSSFQVVAMLYVSYDIARRVPCVRGTAVDRSLRCLDYCYVQVWQLAGASRLCPIVDSLTLHSISTFAAAQERPICRLARFDRFDRFDLFIIAW